MVNINSKLETRNSKQILNSKKSKLFPISNFLFLICLVCFVFLTSYFGFPKTVHAQTLTSPSFTIRQGNFNMTSGTKTSTNYNLTDTMGQTAAEFFSSTGYHVKAGFQYMYTLYDFSFSISSLAINLGTLTPNAFTTASHTLTVTAPGQGYSVTAYETARLTNAYGDTISDTICDSGPCTETSAEIWTTATNNGFGYNVIGDDHDPDFTTASYFRPFPDFSLSESPATVMTTASAGKNRVGTVTYKVSPGSSQAAGDYSTQIIYIATPVY
ncbi:MAG: hypothetical protein UX21_C0014G0004 [Microgenomates group bacterium GW2011_GWC2_45_8]|nr:MAG: hypothetical protein UX21_C0014G0004 [Microgenomates group bacterium GW2011_GWC2_45_8]